MATDKTPGDVSVELQRFGERWAAAERRGDAGALQVMATGDFRLVGPRGFVLDRDQWLQRYRSGDLINESFAWSDVHLRIHDSTAIAIGVQTQKAAYRGQPSDGRFRVTQVIVSEDGVWKLASIQLSPVAESA